MKETTLVTLILWIGLAIIGISLWGLCLSSIAIFWLFLLAGSAMVSFSIIQICKNE
jgi:hypothetical protein